MSTTQLHATHQASDVTVIVSPNRRRLAELEATMNSLRHQEGGSPHIVVAVQEGAIEAIVGRLYPDVGIVRSPDRDLSPDLRNAGAAVATTSLVAFIDEGASVPSDWLRTLLPHFDDECVGGVEPSVFPDWDLGRRPSWFPREFDWALGCSHSAYPVVPIAIRNAFGTGVIVRRDLLNAVGGFRPDRSWESEPTGHGLKYADLCLRMRRERPETRFLHDPATLVRQPVDADRTTLRYLARRCYLEGKGTGRLARNGEPVDGTISMDKRLLTRVLPETVARNLFEATCGRPSGAGRAAVVVGGMACAAVGYLQGQSGRG